MRRLFLSLCLLLPCALRSFPQAAGRSGRDAVDALSQEIHAQLDSLRLQSRSLTEQLLIQEQESEALYRQAEELKAELTALNSCLESTSGKLEDYRRRLTEYEARLKARRNALAALWSLLALMLAVKVALLVLKSRGVRLPYILALWL